MEKYKRIDKHTFSRHEHLAFYETFCSPNVGVTVNVNMGNWLQKLERLNRPFFLSFLYEVAGAANAVPQFRQRLIKGELVEFECCPSSHTVMKEDGTWCTCQLDCEKPFEEFLPYAQKRHEESKLGSGLDNGTEVYSAFFITSTPWYSFTSIVMPVQNPPITNPRIIWGKHFQQEGKTLIPLSVTCHHGLVDGLHIGQFYAELERRLSEA